MSTNHVDGEIWLGIEKLSKTPPVNPQPAETRVPVEPTGLDYRAAALNAAVRYFDKPGRDGDVLWKAEYFERYLRGEAA